MKPILFVLLISGLFPAWAGGVPLTDQALPKELVAKLHKNITVEFKECAFSDVIEYLRKTSDLNFIVPRGSDTKITLSLKNMPLKQVIGFLGELADLNATVEDSSVVFRPKAGIAVAGTGGDHYKLETSVESAGSAHQYVVAVKIQRSPDGQKWDVLSAPKLLVRAGQEGKIEIKNEKSGDGIECTVLVSEIAAGTVEMSVACKLKETGKPQWQSELKTRIKLP